VYDFSKHVKYNKNAFSNVYIEFEDVYSLYFNIEASTGILYVKRELYPKTFSFEIEIEYDVTLKNGTVFSDYEYAYTTVVAIGKNIVLLNIGML